MRNEHGWIEKTETGEKREMRVTKQEGRWRIQSRLGDEELWTYHKHPTVADLQTLRDLLHRKYQRRRTSYEDILLIDRMIHEIT
ncbi:MAG: hypothetical protein ABI615_04100 [Chthoniobacterales bacterium]